MIAPGSALEAAQVALAGAPVVGQVAAGGQLVHLGRLEGWWDAPGTSGTSTQKVADHGVFLGPAFYSGRVMALEARIDGFSPADSMSIANQLLTALPVNDLAALAVTDEAGTLYTSVRQEGDPLLSRQGNRVVVSLSMIAPDPRRYGPVQTASTGLPVATGGFALPAVLPIVIGGSVISGAVVAVNSGDIESYPVFTISGPCPSFTISDDAGRVLSYTDTVLAGRSLVIDTGARTAMLDGTAVRVVTGTWPTLKPGTNQYRFNASSYDAGALMTVSYRSARR